MNFKKYVLECACLCALCSGVAFAAYSGTDPEIEKIKESIKKLEGETNELKETDEEFGTKTESQQKTLEEAKKSVDQMQERLHLRTLRKKTRIPQLKWKSQTKRSQSWIKKLAKYKKKLRHLKMLRKTAVILQLRLKRLIKISKH